MKKKTRLSLLIAICLVCTAMLPGFAQEQEINILKPEESIELQREPAEDAMLIEDLQEPGEPLDFDISKLKSLQGIQTRGSEVIDNGIGTVGGDLADGQDIYLFVQNEARYVFFKLNTTSTDYYVMLCSVNLNTGVVTPVSNGYPAGAACSFNVPQGVWAIAVISTGSVGTNYTVNYNNSVLQSAIPYVEQLWANSDMSKIHIFDENKLYTNGQLKRTLADNSVDLNISFAESMSWSDTSGKRNSNNFYLGLGGNYIDWNDYLKIGSDKIRQGHCIFRYSRKKYSLNSSYVTSDAVIMIPITTRTTYNFNYSEWRQGVQVTNMQRDPYSGLPTPMTLTAEDMPINTYLVYDLNTHTVIDILGKYNLIVAMGYTDPATYARIA